MEKITKTETRLQYVEKEVEVTYYVASDYTQFTDEAECLNYERAISLPYFYEKPNWADYYDSWRWVYVQNPEEMQCAMDAFLNEDSRTDYQLPEYPAWVCISADEENNCYGEVLGTAEEVANAFSDFLSGVLAGMREALEPKQEKMS